MHGHLPKNRGLFPPGPQCCTGMTRETELWTQQPAEGGVNPNNTCFHNTPVLVSGFVQLKAPVSKRAITNKHISAKFRLLQVPTNSFGCLPAFPHARSALDPQELGLSQLCLIIYGPTLQPALYSQETEAKAHIEHWGYQSVLAQPCWHGHAQLSQLCWWAGTQFTALLSNPHLQPAAVFTWHVWTPGAPKMHINIKFPASTLALGGPPGITQKLC